MAQEKREQMDEKLRQRPNQSLTQMCCCTFKYFLIDRIYIQQNDKIHICRFLFFAQITYLLTCFKSRFK